MECKFQKIGMRPSLADLIGYLCSSPPENRESVSPIRYIMDPIIAAGRLKVLHSLVGSYALPEAESEREKIMLASLEKGCIIIPFKTGNSS